MSIFKFDSKELVDNYIEENDWRRRENSNSNFSSQGLNCYISSEIIKDYWLNHVYDEEIRDLYVSGAVHLHDLGQYTAYCAGWDLTDLLTEGFGGNKIKTESRPAKHLSTALSHLCNFMFTLSGEIAGAVAVSNFDTLMAPFIYYDGLTEEKVYQEIQSFVFNMNVPTRTGAQCPFSNLTLDINVPSTFRDRAVIIGGVLQDKSYGEFQEEMNMINRCLFKVLTSGDRLGRVFTFPIPTINVTKDFDWDNTNINDLWEATAKYGIPYFANYINSDMSPEDALSMCPLSGDTKVIVKVDKQVKVFPIEKIYEEYKKELIQILTPEGMCFSRPIKVKSKDLFKVTTKDGTSVEMGGNHLQPVDGKKTLKAKDLKVGMKLPFDDGSFSEITKITQKNNDKDLYCFEVDNNGHLFTLANGLITHNCRLRIDKSKLHHRGGGLFGSAGQTGSIGVVTINLPQAAYYSSDEKEFLEEVGYIMDVARRSLEIKREKIEELTENGLYPYAKHFLRNLYERDGKYWNNHFSTIGIVGGNEACVNLIGKPISSPEGVELIKRLMQFMNDKLVEFQNETGTYWNLEATPAEGTAFRLAKKDKEEFGDIATFSGTDKISFYTNSTQLPVDYTDDVFTLLDLQDDIQSMYTGGTVQHMFLGERQVNPCAVKKFIKKVFENYKLPYLSITPTFSICRNHGYISGEHEECPTCKEECEIYSRVVGYIRPVSTWNDGKRQEFQERKYFKIER